MFGPRPEDLNSWAWDPLRRPRACLVPWLVTGRWGWVRAVVQNARTWPLVWRGLPHSMATREADPVGDSLGLWGEHMEKLRGL